MSSIVHIPSTAPFIDSLVRAILNGDLPAKNQGKDQPAPPKVEDLSKITVLLPTRRACRVCGEAFLRLSGSKAIILPTIRPLGDGGEDEGLIHEAVTERLSGTDTGTDTDQTGPDPGLIDMKPAVSNLERHLFLTQTILSWRKTTSTHLWKELEETFYQAETKPAQASLMARELAKLIDNAETEQVDLGKLDQLVPDKFSDHWQQTLEFLSIITKLWPEYLVATEQLSMAARRNLLLSREAERLQQSKPENPVIIAGSTGSIPAAARLLKAVASLENGTIVLPGLDQHLEDEAFENLVPNHPEHPQFGLAKLLSDIGIKRVKIPALKGTEPTDDKQELISFVSEALRPSSSTERWQDYIANIEADKIRANNLQKGFENISLNVARDAQEEAEMISLILRRSADHPGKTAALVTPDRLLARRVTVRLEQWGIKVDDSGGRPLSKTMPGTFFDAIIEAAGKGFEPSSLLALLKHPLTRLGFKRGDSRLAARALEISALRRPWLGGGLEGVKATFNASREKILNKQKGVKDQHIHPAISRLSEEEWTLATTLLDRLIMAFTPLAAFKNNAAQPLENFINAHIEVAENLADEISETDADKIPEENKAEKGSSIWLGAAGEQLARLLAELLLIKQVSPPLTINDYPEFYRSLIAGETVRPLTPVHPRIFIWGPFESRLQQPDVVILGGLNESTWPNTANASPWLSRPMCQELGLPAPEQHIGYGAHDFASLLKAKEVHLTRAAKTDGVETVPSRWIMRMNALLEGLKASSLLNAKPEEPFVKWASLRDKVTPTDRVSAPAPTPPVDARPRQLSVTRIEDWIANPYSIFARNILNLIPLDALGTPPDASMRGQIIHKAMQIFTEKYPQELPEDAADQLINIAATLMKDIAIHPQIGAFWQPRFNRFANWFAETEPERRKGLKQIHTELDGRLEINVSGKPFILTARADRIDEANDGSFHIYDYKTGTVPTAKEVENLFSPQLPLEAAIQQQKGFEKLSKGPVTSLAYIEAKGADPAGVEYEINQDLEALIEKSLSQLEKLITRFDKVETPYKAMRRHKFKAKYRFDDYAHLARVEEWGTEEEGEPQS